MAGFRSRSSIRRTDRRVDHHYEGSAVFSYIQLDRRVPEDTGPKNLRALAGRMRRAQTFRACWAFTLCSARRRSPDWAFPCRSSHELAADAVPGTHAVADRSVGADVRTGTLPSAGKAGCNGSCRSDLAAGTRSSKSLQPPTMPTVLTQTTPSFRVIRSGRMDVRTSPAVAFLENHPRITYDDITACLLMRTIP